jgi:hypothetical protein
MEMEICMIDDQSNRKAGERKPWWNRENHVLRLLLCLLLALGVLVLIYPYTEAGKQSRNLAIAREQAPGIEKELHEDVRFLKVTAAGYTGGGGMIWILGEVYGGEEELTALKERVEKMKLPLPVHYTVKVYELTEEEKKTVRGR